MDQADDNRDRIGAEGASFAAGLGGPADRDPAWLVGLLAAPGPIAMALSAAMVAPLALTTVGKPWLGLVVLAGAGLFWWTVLWMGGQVAAPSVWRIVPALVLMVMFMSRPIVVGGVGFFSLPVAPASLPSAADAALALDREMALLAMQKLTVMVLLAAPLCGAIWLDRWTVTLFRMCLLLGLAGLLAMAVVQVDQMGKGGGAGGRSELAGLRAVAPMHLAAALAATVCWLTGTLRASLKRFAADRLDHVEGDWAEALRSPQLAVAALAALVGLGACAMFVICATGRDPWLPWDQMAPWVGMLTGLTAMLTLRRAITRWLGLALLAAGVIGAVRLWPWPMVRDSLAAGGLTGSGDWDPRPGDCAGVLGLLRWRGLLGLTLAGLAAALAAGFQFAAWRRIEEPAERLAAGGALAGSWLIVAGWLIGPGQVTGPAAFLALSLWALSMAPAGRPGGRDVTGAGRADCGSPAFAIGLLVVVVCSYGLLGLTHQAHDRLWMGLSANGGDKKLHAIWGLYVTLACCLAVAPLGRWVAVSLGLAGSVAMAIGAELVQRRIGRNFEWLDVAAYAGAGAMVAAALLAGPYSWGRRRRVRGTRQGPLGSC